MSGRAPLSVVVHQTAPLRGEVEANRCEIEGGLEGSEAGSLHLFPELSLTGYDLGVRARDLALDADRPPPLQIPVGVRAVLGFPERAGDGRTFNSAGLALGGSPPRWLHLHRKIYLPTYGSFDEGRIFAPADRGPDVVELVPGWPGATLICEDLWHPSLVWLAALRGAQILVVLAAAPGRPLLDSGPDPDSDSAAGTRDGAGAPPLFGSVESWRVLARAAAFTHGIWVVLVNRAGVEGGITFAGSSMVVAPDGTVVAEAGPGPDRLALELDPGAVGRARRSWSHLRDDRPDHLLNELHRAGGAWPGRPGRGSGSG